ncbi:MAG: type II toxin-antitoxin system RelE/ParE family toxin [Oscillospiraceae bacterium]|jgi:toxin ParE1/3/4|nr:type II toxin-antitoxin system RelE/ParE family toxin [Oscillospiraceae bacterium]
MAYSIRVSEDAHGDADAIAGYIAGHLKNPSAAVSFLDDVDESYARLRENPFICPQCRDLRLAEMGVRFVAIKNYLILFRIDQENGIVYILRIVYSGRNYAELF